MARGPSLWKRQGRLLRSPERTHGVGSMPASLRTVVHSLVHAGLVGSAFVVFWVGGVFLSYVWLPVVRRFAPTPLDARLHSHAVIRHGFASFMHALRITRLFNFDPRRNRRVFEDPCVFVANHPTLLDVVAILSCYERLCCVVKPSLYRSFSVGPLLRTCGHLCGSDGTADASQQLLEQAVGRLRDGFSVLVFPEGTRSPAHGLGPFLRGAFEIAARAAVPIVPVSIHCDPPALLRGMPWYRVPVDFVDYGLTELEPRTVSPGRSSVRRSVEEVADILRPDAARRVQTNAVGIPSIAEALQQSP